MTDDARRTDSGIEIEPVYFQAHLEGFEPDQALGRPGEPPYTRGVYASMYRERPWTMRQYAGFGTAEETNQRFHYLLEAGQTGLSCAFDLPTQMGYDSDHPRAHGEVGKVGVAIDSLEDMERLLDGIPLDRVTTSMTINSTAPILLLLYELVAEKQGVASDQIGGTVQNDLLKEYVARGTVQELAFTLSNAIAYVEAAVAAGLDVDEFAPRLSFFWNGHNNFFEEVAKFRASRRMWYRIMTERFGAKDERSKLMRFHTQTGGSTLTAQQPENNIVRVALQGMAAVLGGTQSLHTNGFDEALGLPTERAAKIALRTQQIVAYESGVTDTVDPLAGSYFVEWLTDQVEAKAWEYIEKVDAMGGAVAAIEAGYMQAEIENSAFEWARAVDGGSKVIVGVNRFVDESPEPADVFPIDPELERRQSQRVAELRERRDSAAVKKALEDVRSAARGDANLLYPMKDALRAFATLGEVSDVLREEFGVYQPSR
ncbi:MAG: methylmalonyl-CoA mutase [Actinobacteria bacterium]|nr:methylmalonyl-CoA mutase [Actinomycetota bacterium]